jgi:hypothetical protein
VVAAVAAPVADEAFDAGQTIRIQPSEPPLAQLEPRVEAPAEQSVNVTAAWSPQDFAERFGEADADVTPQSQTIQLVAAVAEQEDAAGTENVRDSGEVEQVLSRLVKAGLWRSNEQPPEGSDNVEQPPVAFAPPAAMEAPAAGPPPVVDIENPSAAAASFENPSALAAEFVPAAAPAAEPLFQPPLATDSAPLTDDEETIESYMERLMKRVRGDAPGANPGWKPAEAPVQESVALPQSPAPAPQPAEQPQEAEPGEYSPRRTAPELNTNLTAMRELANTAARSAIDRHVRQHTGRQALGKLIGACLTVLASSVLGYWAWRVQTLQAYVGAGIGGALGAYWTWAAIRRLIALRRLNVTQQRPEVSADGSACVPAATDSRNIAGK